jgi:Fic family protein
MTDEGASRGYRRRPGLVGASPESRQRRAVASSTTPDETLAATGVAWDAARIPFERIAATTVERARFRFLTSLPQMVWNAAALEGNTFTLPEVQTLLDGVTVGGRAIEDERQVYALVDAYSRLDAITGDGTFALTKPVSDDLHGRVAVHEAIESGAFRGEGSVSGGGSVRLATGGVVDGVPQAELEERFRRTISFLDSLADPRERALGYFAAATRSQFYFDGNKRTARLMMTGELVANGFEPLSVPVSRKYEFNKALDELFTTDDATTLMSFVADCAD